MMKLTDEERLYEREEGKLEGKLEGLHEVAKNMLKENLPIEIIIKTTGLTKDEIQIL